jgi:hypothetical protein
MTHLEVRAHTWVSGNERGVSRSSCEAGSSVLAERGPLDTTGIEVAGNEVVPLGAAQGLGEDLV